MRLADYVADFFVQNGITQAFSVVGGGSMYLNDALGHKEGLKVIYTQHEQAASMAAEGWARITGDPAGVCVTSGPGGVNAMNGVLGAWLDSIPMFVLSGQVRYATTVQSTGLNLRQQGEQEYPIVDSVRPMTKYAVMLDDPSSIRYHLERALYESTTGRRGPVWIDIPMDFQNAQVDPESLEEFVPPVHHYDYKLDEVLDALSHARRPVIVGGSGIRSSESLGSFRTMVHKLGAPVLGAQSIVDLFPWSDNLYMGTFGSLGGRAGNYMVQHADLILSLGCSLSYKHTGFNYESFAPQAKIISVNVEPDELKKPNVTIDLPIVGDIAEFIPLLTQAAPERGFSREGWLTWCRGLKDAYPTYQEKFAREGKVNPYEAGRRLFELLPDDGIVLLGNGVGSVTFLQAGVQTESQRNFGNANCGSMGWDLPAAMGAAVAAERPVWLIAGDGSLQMNIQELQTIDFNKIPVKIVLFNNGGYESIVISQTKAFGRTCGCVASCGEGVPNFEAIAKAYNFSYRRCEKNSDIASALQWCAGVEGSAFLEVLQDENQGLEPRVQSKRLPDGSIASPVLTDLSPFLPEEEVEGIMDDLQRLTENNG